MYIMYVYALQSHVVLFTTPISYDLLFVNIWHKPPNEKKKK